MRFALLLFALANPALAQSPTVPLAECLARGVLAQSAPEGLGPVLPAALRPSVRAATLAGGPALIIELEVERPGDAAQTLQTAADDAWFSPDGAAFALLPGQRCALEAPASLCRFKALALSTKKMPAAGTALKAAKVTNPAAVAVLRAAAAAGPELEPDALRFAILAATSGYTIQETADWLRIHRNLALEPAVDEAKRLAPLTEDLLAAAGLNHRVFSHAHADYHFNIGVRAYARSDLKAATKAFKAAIERSPKMISAHYNLAVVLYRAGDFKRASTALLVASGFQDMNDADVFYNRGATLYKLDNLLGAARAFRAALLLNPEDSEAADWLAKADPEHVTAPKKKKKKRRRRGRRRGR